MTNTNKTNKRQFTEEEMKILNYRPTKPFAELTEAEKQERIQIYEKQKEILGLKEGLFAVIRTFDLRQNKDNSLNFGFVAKDYETGEYKTMNAYIPEGKDELKDFYLSLKPGNTVSIVYKENEVGDKVFYNARQVFIRHPKTKK